MMLWRLPKDTPAHLLSACLRVHIEDDALAERGDVELIHLLLAHLLVVGLQPECDNGRSVGQSYLNVHLQRT